jgi:hypothetical protein
MIQDTITTASDSDLVKSMLAEAAKATNEIKCARRDVDKAESRLSFILLILNSMINRTQGDKS